MVFLKMIQWTGKVHTKITKAAQDLSTSQKKANYVLCSFHGRFLSFDEDFSFLWSRGIRNWDSTVRSDVEERVAEERLAWNDKNIPGWPKNISVL